ncbi:hypothetical protein [Phytohabitans houttuyneae]|uniref:Uncharacterized protein n=1 Tax=Phytohabitans houttuyneae TaxID=1076126 RepID=A0A6V8KG98_9ACTN|nr:hypothetical protein [Phytohabitans houttuyneae]GFJ81066.1 hypothetical protein Phou_052460 [Phytohabitans houttuyneae]
MDSRLDCVVIGYNDPPLSFHEHRLMEMDEAAPERRVFMREHLMVEGVRRAPMDIVNHYARQQPGIGPDPYYHVGEVPNLAAVYLASFLRRRGFTAEYVSLFRPERARLEELLERRRPGSSRSPRRSISCRGRSRRSASSCASAARTRTSWSAARLSTISPWT